MSSYYLKLLFIPVVLAATPLTAGMVTINSATMSIGYMNVFELPSNGGGFVFGSGWGIGDLNASFSNSSTVLFTPNTIGDPDPFWYTPSGGPGAAGNKIMEANLYAETSALAGQNLLFNGNVSSFTLAPGYEFRVFIKDFAPDYSSAVIVEQQLTGTGSFSINLDLINDSSRHFQWGLQMKGPNVWATDVGSMGSVTVTAPVPEPSLYAAAFGAAGIAFAFLRRRFSK